MARSAKTNHVMSLVEEKSKKSSPQKDGQENSKPKIKENSPIKMFNPALIPIEAIENEQRSNAEKDHKPQQTEGEEYEQRSEERENAYIDSQEISPKKEGVKADDPEPQREQETKKAQETKSELQNEPAEDIRKNAITAIIPELINQELEAITKRFHITPTDSNLWQLTKEALETIRPEFSRNAEEYEEKCGRLRQRVILEMTKAAIRISKSSRK